MIVGEEHGAGAATAVKALGAALLATPVVLLILGRDDSDGEQRSEQARTDAKDLAAGGGGSQPFGKVIEALIHPDHSFPRVTEPDD